MPGPSPAAAVKAFLDPLRDAATCIGGAHFTLSPQARKIVGETHSWVLNDNHPVSLGGAYYFRAAMHFEILDLGVSNGRGRYRVSTRGYQYAVELAHGKEILTAHWHPSGSVSSYTEPHWHVGSPALSSSGVFPARAHIPSPRISFEDMIRWIFESLDVEPACDDWRQRLLNAERGFLEHKSW